MTPLRRRGRRCCAALLALTAACAVACRSGTETPAEVERRVARLKAEIAVTPHFCSLENRPCRDAKRAAIDRSVAFVLERCGEIPRGNFDRCVRETARDVVRALGTPTP